MQGPGFWNLIARHYARQPVADEASYRRKLDETAASLTPDMALFEFGCGTGTTALHHAGRVARVDAIDFAPKMIAIAREKAKAQGARNVRFEVARIEDWPAGPGSYDVVLGMSILHLVDDRPAVLRRVHELLKPGGLFFSSTACLGGQGGLAERLLPLIGRTGLLPNVRFFSEDDLLAGIRASGFGIEDHWRPGPKKAVFVKARKA